jgi:hypothetical protein
MCFYVRVNCTFTVCKANRSESFQRIYRSLLGMLCKQQYRAHLFHKNKTKWKNRLSQLRSQADEEPRASIVFTAAVIKIDCLGRFCHCKHALSLALAHTHTRAHTFSLHQTEIIIRKKNCFQLQKHETTRAERVTFTI